MHMTSRSTEGHKKVICKRCEVKKVKKQKWANDALGAHGNKRGCLYWHLFSIFSGAFFRNQNNSLSYRANFSKSGIPVFHLFSLHIAYKWPSCDLQLTLRSYAHIWAFRELKGEHFDIGYQLVWCNLVLKQWSMVYQSEAG